MGKARKITPVKLIIGFIFAQEAPLRKAKATSQRAVVWLPMAKATSQRAVVWLPMAKAILERHFGRIDFESQLLDFNKTAYYEKEFGINLKRQFISFSKLIAPARLPKIKTLTNALELKLSRAGSRLINIDPGYLDLAKLVLATTKDYNHRLYLDKGIYAEVTLFYRGKSFQPWQWTYPDYKTITYIAIFNRIREIYAGQIKDEKR